MEELTIVDVVLILKPLCDSFMVEPSAEKATKIATLVNKTSNAILQKICENILYPITHHLKINTLSKDDNINLIQCVQVVISKIRIEKLKLFYEIYHCLRIQICQHKNTMELIEIHEELKEIVILCLNDLISNCSISIIESFYTRQNAALLSHGVYICIKIARLEKSISLRLSALKAIMTLLQVHEKAESQDAVLRDQIADVIMLYLPGIASGLLEIALSTDIQNHKITMMAIRVWSRAIALVMQDIPEEQRTEPPSVNLKNLKLIDSRNAEKVKHILENAQRTPDWYSAVSEKFKIIFIELDTLAKNSHFKVRQELAEATSLLLMNCSRNMKACFQILLEILITLSEDENSKVFEKARKNLCKIQNKFFRDKSMKSIIEIVEENLYNLLLKLPRIIRTSDESLQLVWLNRLSGYLKILGKQRLSTILLSTAHLQKLLLSLVYIAELDNSNISILEDINTTNFEETIYHEISGSWKQYKFLFDSTCIEKLNSIFRILGELADHKILIDSILKLIFEIPKFKKELILMLNIILEVPEEDSVKQMSICKQAIDNYIALNTWDLPITVSEEINLSVAQNNIIQCCLLLEGLGIMAKVLEEKYQDFLLKTLYIVIERAGSKHPLLRFCGLSTLEIITKSQKLDKVGDLFRANCDYISYHVTVKLRRVERNPGVLDVVEVVTKYSTMDFLPQLKEIVYDLLLQSGSSIQKRNTQSFLKVFLAFVMCVKTLTSNNSKKTENHFDDSKILKPSDIVINEVLEYYNATINSKLYEKDENLENENETNLTNDVTSDTNIESQENSVFYEDEKEKEIPYFITMIKDIMNHCLNFVSSQDFNESTLSMTVLQEGAYVLKDWENVLLPIVHKLWHPLIDRFQNSNFLVINIAFQLLCCLSKVSQSFIRSRTLKQVLPNLSNFLKTSAKESYKKDSVGTYKYTQIFKLQKQILSQLSTIVKYLNVLEKDVWNILTTAECYLDCYQHKELQEYCIKMYKDISEYNTDILWIKCIDIWNRHVEIVMVEDNLDKWYAKVVDYHEKSPYQRNTLQILTYIHTKYKML